MSKRFFVLSFLILLAWHNSPAVTRLQEGDGGAQFERPEAGVAGQGGADSLRISLDCPEDRRRDLPPGCTRRAPKTCRPPQAAQHEDGMRQLPEQRRPCMVL